MLEREIILERLRNRPHLRVIGGTGWRVDSAWFRSKIRRAVLISLGIHFFVILACWIPAPRHSRPPVRFNSIPVSLVRIAGPSSIAGRARGEGIIRSRLTPKAPEKPAKGVQTIASKGASKTKSKPRPPAPKNAMPIPNPKMDSGSAEEAAVRDSVKAAPILRQEIQLGGGAQGALEMSVDGPISAYAYYLMTVRDKVASNWEPPQGISAAGRETAAIINFRIDRSGKVAASYVEEPSGIGSFDAASLRAVIESSPLPPLPQDYLGDWLGIHLRFVYNE
jgi:TonB family protein